MPVDTCFHELQFESFFLQIISEIVSKRVFIKRERDVSKYKSRSRNFGVKKDFEAELK